MMRRNLLLVAAATALAGSLHAHEIGTTRIEAEFRDRAYLIQIHTDGETLLNRLEVAAGLPRSRGLEAPELQARLQNLILPLREKTSVLFDEQTAAPWMSVLVEDGTSGAYPVTIRLEGPVPENARSFSWSSELTPGSYSVELRNGNTEPSTRWLEGDQKSDPFPLDQSIIAPSRMHIALLYLRLGITHIVPRGLDHILFVLGIFLLSTRWSNVLSQVTAFTVAHTITLAMTMYGLISLSPRVVEPMIAISIMYVAIENLFTTHVHTWRIALVFAFGLLHGMGFAGVLHELGLPRSEFITALLSFNVGVELGQLLVIAAAAVLIGSWARRYRWYRPRVVVPISLVIAVTGLFWTVQRLSS